MAIANMPMTHIHVMVRDGTHMTHIRMRRWSMIFVLLAAGEHAERCREELAMLW
jgi:hypothetical protein